ncbi:MAG: tRNA pseudouridine(38-40) synthase TruA [Planctomycetota bacterium]|nr:tRNA pseudouridine(38-40) synthase TruA [Planctomycetota bacterium]
MPRYRLIIAYDGTDFHGWQRQLGADGQPLRTVQWCVEQAVTSAIKHAVPVVGASRTDAGVHAEGQCASFAVPVDVPAGRLTAALNARLPRDIQIRAAVRVSDGFDPIRDCDTKRYRYALRDGCRHGHRTHPFESRFVTEVVHDLELGAMQAAAGLLVGQHDFKGLAGQTEGKETTVRTVHACDVSRGPEGIIRVSVQGDGFLYNMVRIIVGTLVEVGRGRMDTDGIRRILATGDRTLAGPTMPPQGLCLEWVHYPREVPLETEQCA